MFFLFSIKSFTTEGSAKVEVSPKFSNSFDAIFLKILLIIFPDLVFGKPAVICIKSGVAIGPIFSLIVFFKSKTKFSGSLEKVVESFSEEFSEFDIDLRDGIKINFENSWTHIRKSNTEPVVRIISEAKTLDEASAISNKIISKLHI